MIELDGPIMPATLPRFTEAAVDSSKRGSGITFLMLQSFLRKYAMMSENINGPWDYKGILNEIAGNSNTNHQAIIEFKGNWYFVYHNGELIRRR